MPVITIERSNSRAIIGKITFVQAGSARARNNKEILFALTRPYLEALNRDIFRVRQSEEGLKGGRKVLHGANFANFLEL